MRDPSDASERPVEHHVRWRVRRRTENSLDDIPVEINNDHVVRFQRAILDPAWLDDHQTIVSADPADVAPCERHEAELHQLDVCPADFFS